MIKAICIFLVGIFYGVVIALWFNLPYYENAGFFTGFFISFVPIALIFWRFIKYPVKKDEQKQK